MAPEDRTTAFSLIELMVVVVIIGLLAGLLLPTLSRSRENSRSTKCLNNMRQFGFAVRMYLDEAHNWPENMLRLEPFVQHHANRGDSLWYCPAWKQTPLDPPGRFSDYFLNLKGSGISRTDDQLLGIGFLSLRGIRGRAEQDVIQPVEMITMAEMGEANITAPPTSELWQYLPFRYSNSTILLRHNRGANVLFGDGHVKLSNRENLIGGSPSVRRRWNRDHEPHDENWR